MEMIIAVQSGPNPQACVPVVGLPYADYDRVSDKIEAGTKLRIEPVSNNPHDPLAIEVWFDGVETPARIGFVPRDFTRALRLALHLEEMDKEVFVIRTGALAFGLPADMLQSLLAVTMPRETPVDEDGDEIDSDEIMEGYRSFFPGEEEDPDAPQCGEELIEREAARLIAANPDLDPDEAYDEALASMETKVSVIPDPSLEPASASPKFGGLPYAEAGWDWPRCPSCGDEVVFVAQVQDPEMPGDLVQIFHCEDEEMQCCSHWAQEDPAEYSLVRLWRDPSAKKMAPITPKEASNILPAHRFDAIEHKPEGSAPTTFGGRGCSLNAQYLEDDGYRRVADIWFPRATTRLLSTDVLVILRHGKGRICAFADDG